jgi:hypothetical protein
MLLGRAIDGFQRVCRCAWTVATLSRSLLTDRCLSRVGYLCEPSSL